MFDRLLPLVDNTSVALLKAVEFNREKMFDRLLPLVDNPRVALFKAVELDREEMFNQLLPKVNNSLDELHVYNSLNKYMFGSAKLKEKYEQFIKSFEQEKVAKEKGLLEQASDTLSNIDKSFRFPGADAASIQYINNLDAIAADAAFMQEMMEKYGVNNSSIGLNNPLLTANATTNTPRVGNQDVLKYGALLAVSGYALVKAGQALGSWLSSTPSVSKERALDRDTLLKKTAKLQNHLQELEKEFVKTRKLAKSLTEDDKKMLHVIKEQIDNYTDDLGKLTNKSEAKELKAEIKHASNQLNRLTLKNAVEHSKDKVSKNVGTSLVKLNKLENTIAKLLDKHELPKNLEKELKEERKEIKKIINAHKDDLHNKSAKDELKTIQQEIAPIFKKLGDTTLKINNSTNLDKGSKVLLEEIKSLKEEIRKITKSTKDVLYPMREDKLKKLNDQNKGKGRG
jgi:hypothetical protein